MSRLRRERVERLIRSFQGEPTVKVVFAPWIAELRAEGARRRAAAGDPRQAEAPGVASRAGDAEALAPRSDASESGR